MSSPSWILLLWTGIAATLFAAAVVAPITSAGGSRGALLYMKPAGTIDFLLLLALGLLAYPLLYGVIMDALHTASLFIGMIIGFAHGGLLTFAALRRRPPRNRGSAVRAIIITHIVYGAVVGFLYVTP